MGNRQFEAKMRHLDMKISFWKGFTIGAAVCGVAVILSLVAVL